MRLSGFRPCCTWLALIAGALLASAQASEPTTEPTSNVLPEPIATAEREFAIPFVVELLDRWGEPLSAVQLHVSEDHGRSWRLYEEAQPEQGSFAFRAMHDGEYWFLVRSVDRRGRIWPEGPAQAELRVVVGNVHAQQHVTAGFPIDRLPIGERPRMVNTMSFELEYDVQSRDGAPIRRVELWWTGDGGRTWKPFGPDHDCRSPMLVSVEQEGLYGFWMVIEDTLGVQGAAPHEGDLPQVWVGVDTTSPDARLITAETIRRGDNEQLSIRWEASDALLATAPITLGYSATPRGPWTTLSANRENNGVYTCPVNDRLPESFYLRLEVRDEAGNARVVTTADPVMVAHAPVTPRPASSGSKTDTARSPKWYQVLR